MPAQLHARQCPIPDCQHPACVAARAAEALLPHHVCTRCSRSLPESRFSSRTVNGVQRRQSWCRECAAAHARQARANGGSTRRARTSAAMVDGQQFDRQFGVEIETEGATRSDIMREFQNVGLAIRDMGYTHQVMTEWKIVTDSSLSNGLEIVSPILRGSDGRRQVRLAMQALQAAGARVSSRCGLHVHHDVTDLTAGGIYRLVSQWAAAAHVVDGLVAPSRRGGNWCAGLTASDVDRARRWAEQHGESTHVPAGQSAPSIDRYRSMNVTSYALYGTVEIRQHQGTLNAAKALAWISLGQAFIARAKAGDATAPGTIRDLLASLEEHGLDSGTAAFLEDRHTAFAGGRAEA